MDKQLVDKFFVIMDDLKKNVFNKASAGELSKSEFSMLYHIKQMEEEEVEVTTSFLSGCLQISKPAISQMINILEDKQYIQRIIKKSDRRLMCVALTDLGNQVIEKAILRHVKNVNVIFDKMGSDDSEKFVVLFEKYVSILKETLDDAK
jgi:DNA-binding MarR family transcriptional regulator